MFRTKLYLVFVMLIVVPAVQADGDEPTGPAEEPAAPEGEQAAPAAGGGPEDLLIMDFQCIRTYKAPAGVPVAYLDSDQPFGVGLYFLLADFDVNSCFEYLQP